MRKTLVLVVVAGISLALAPTAQAATRDLTDPTGDVTAESWDSDGHMTRSRDGGAELDVVFARIQHTATQVVVYTRYRQLTVPQQYGWFSYNFQGNNRKQANVYIETRHAKPQGTGDAIALDGRRCPFSHRINYAGDSVSMRISRGCLNKPKYVRLSQVSATERYRFDGSALDRYDSPTRDGGNLDQMFVSRTPWVVTG
jgi:hypothetical protein